jgi:acyl-CoA reductase-like NAD-dependent aldehyde dehydrogenase
MRDEIFGPILPVVPYQSIDEAIKYINDGEKPLALYYFGSQKGANARRIEKETSSGAYVVNDAIYQVFNIELPFGGVGYSGYGRYHGIDGFHAFSNKKSVLIKPPVKMYPYN